MTESPTHVSWRSMRQRCKPDGKYGQRGITVCERWNNFVNFLADMGERPDGMTLDRINNERGYEPDNCRWVPPEIQHANKRVIGTRPCAPGCTCGRHKDKGVKCEPGCACYKHFPPPRTAEWNAKIAESNRVFRARVREALQGVSPDDLK